MNEKIITLDSVEPVEIYGVNDVKLNIIQKHFPKLKIVARGYSIKLLGNSQEITRFEKKLDMLVDHFHKNGVLTDTVIERLLGQTGDNLLDLKDDISNNDIILFGNNGLVIKAKTPNQLKKESQTTGQTVESKVSQHTWRDPCATREKTTKKENKTCELKSIMQKPTSITEKSNETSIFRIV
jgi:hypothetical protein